MDRDRRIKEYMSKRARPGAWKESSVTREAKKKYKNFKLKKGYTKTGENTYQIRAGYCPCAVCNHEYMWECEDNDCQCCKHFCS